MSWGCVAGVGVMEHDALCMAWLFLLGGAGGCGFGFADIMAFMCQRSLIN